ncbi:MAG: 5-formyltetrahydrofolate cyclo-ligase [Sedimentibacter sp.]
METKLELRKRILNIRNNMPKDEAEKKSNIIINKLTTLNEYEDSKLVFVYMSFGNEVDTFELIKRMLKENKRVVIPYTDTKNTVIIPSELKSLEDDLILSKFGYYEPIYEKIKKVEPEEFDLIVTPGVVFDKNLNRVGFGKGYYDRILLRKRKDAKAVAVAYEFQVLEDVPAEAHDIKMDMIITEENIYK